MSKTEPYFLDDRVVIPKEVKEMSKEDLDREIAKLEEEARKKMTNQYWWEGRCLENE